METTGQEEHAVHRIATISRATLTEFVGDVLSDMDASADTSRPAGR